MSWRFPKRKWTGPYIAFSTLDGNHHGPRIEGPADSYDHEILRSTWQVVTLDNGMMPAPRYLWGKRLWIYGPSGACCSFDILWTSRRRYAQSEANSKILGELYVAQQTERGEWPPKRSDGSKDFLAAMLHGSGLGLKLIERTPDR